jgi:hypothetical protein
MPPYEVSATRAPRRARGVRRTRGQRRRDLYPGRVAVTASADSTGGLAACPFWASGITPPPRPDTPFTPPLQTAVAVNFSARAAAPTLTGTFQNGQVSLTVSRVPGRGGVPDLA